MPPKTRAKRDNVGFEPLYDDNTSGLGYGGSLSGDFFESNNTKRRLVQKSAVLHIGPKWRDEHVTPFRATNRSVIVAQENDTQQLFDYIVDDLSSGTVRAYDDCDIMLDEYIHPDSPKMISVFLRDLAPSGEASSLSQNIPVPLYLCLTSQQMANAVLQHGIPVRESNFINGGNPDAYPLQLIPCNRNSGYRSGTKNVSPNLLENFVNEIAGRLNRQIATNDGNWDKGGKYFQNVEFKFRVGPRNTIALGALQGVARGKGESRAVTKREAEQVEEPTAKKVLYKNQKDQFKGNEEPPTERDLQLDNIGEDGSSQAAMIEWRFQLTTHRLMSPQLHAAFQQAATQIGTSFPTHKSIRPYLENPSKRSQLANLIEFELLEGETNLRVYTDARAQERALQKKIYAIFCLKSQTT